jgi:hypothetical protein
MLVSVCPVIRVVVVRIQEQPHPQPGAVVGCHEHFQRLHRVTGSVRRGTAQAQEVHADTGMRILTVAASIAALLHLSIALDAQTGNATPRVELQSAPVIRLSGEADSNSPAVWDRVAGRNRLFVLTSMSGRPSTASGIGFTQLGTPKEIVIEPWPGGGVWMEAVIKDVDGTWYGYYHNENVANMCRGTDKVIPRIGAARSRDLGATWEPLGVILEAPPRTYDCTTENAYFVGGVGDFSVQLDPESRDLYFFHSLYLRELSSQGVAVARLAWADRDAPSGKMMVWRGSSWVPATPVGGMGMQRWVYPAAAPIFPAVESWHDDDEAVEAYWGPSVHWNTFVQRYVMLLSKAKNTGYDQEGVYISYATALDDPRGWSAPSKILNGGTWYPQVLGIEAGVGTDKIAGEWARFYMMGTSHYFLRFTR